MAEVEGKMLPVEADNHWENWPVVHSDPGVRHSHPWAADSPIVGTMYCPCSLNSELLGSQAVADSRQAFARVAHQISQLGSPVVPWTSFNHSQPTQGAKLKAETKKSK